jgi:hypothetical protein
LHALDQLECTGVDGVDLSAKLVAEHHDIEKKRA